MPTIDRRLVLFLAVAAFCAALVAGRIDGPGSSAPPARAAAPTAAPSTGPTPTAAAIVVVDVAGAVRRPGVYRLRGGARVADAVARAGGPRPRAALEAVNLAALAVDGAQVLVPFRGAAPAAAAPGATTAAGPVHLAAADAAALDALPGIGPSTAARIIAWRDANGPFRSVDDLLQVPGIGPAKLAALRPLVEP